MTVVIHEEPVERLAEQAEVPIAFLVDRVLQPTIVDGGLGGITFEETVVAEPWTKDYDAIDGETPGDWATKFDVTSWGMLVARDGERRIGGVVIAHDTPNLHMLDGRRDLSVVWDIRVHPDHRSTEVGRRLWLSAVDWARARGCRQLKVETQNVNVGACRFYARMGCTVGAIDRYAYAPELPDEIQVLWYLDL